MTEPHPLAGLVKPLIWQETRDGNYRKGECFHTRSPVNFAPIAAHKGHKGWWLNVDCKTYPTLETAQAAAQADYTASILAALDVDKITALVGAAYIQGAMDVHQNWQPDRAPDFSEAAADYVAALASIKGDQP